LSLRPRQRQRRRQEQGEDSKIRLAHDSSLQVTQPWPSRSTDGLTAPAHQRRHASAQPAMNGSEPHNTLVAALSREVAHTLHPFIAGCIGKCSRGAVWCSRMLCRRVRGPRGTLASARTLAQPARAARNFRRRPFVKRC
jgi:hypothetical protein